MQDTDAKRFSQKLRAVFLECNRVLRDQGLLVFSYHHSRESGWIAVADAVLGARFSIVQSQPVKSEMSVATPKTQAKQPINLDVLIICRKRTDDQRRRSAENEALEAAMTIGTDRVERFNSAGRELSLNDVRVIVFSQLLVELSPGRGSGEMNHCLNRLLPKASSATDGIWDSQVVGLSADRLSLASEPQQLSLFEAAVTG